MTTTGYQAQHILPDSVFRNFARQINAWTGGGFDVQAGYNFIHLPDNSEWSANTGYVRHNGGHLAYKAFVERMLQETDNLPLTNAQKGDAFRG